MHTDPKTKEQFIDRILSYDFNGDFSALGQYQAQVIRTSSNKFSLQFPASGQRYEIVVRKPRDKKAKRPAVQRRAGTTKVSGRRSVRA